MFWEELYIRSPKLVSNMVHLLYKYLIIHKQVAIPGVGVFYIDRKPAQHDVANKVFQSPVLNIDFRAGMAITDKEFFQFVSRENGIDEVEAVKSLHEFAHLLKQQVSTHKRVELPGMGVLIKNATGQVTFEPTNVLTTYFPPVIEERLFKETKGDSLSDDVNAEQKEALYEQTIPSSERKDPWWIFAIVLAIIAIAAISYYYYINGSLGLGRW
jgi:nucleoid DNA-binding protein